MDKDSFAKYIAKEKKIYKVQAKEIIDVFMSSIIEALKDGEEVSIPKFGTFKIIERKEKKIWNFQKKETVLKTSSEHPKFKPSKYFKYIIKGKRPIKKYQPAFYISRMF